MKINWDLLVKLIEKFRDEAERCLDRGIYLAGLVLVRAALEAALQSRFLLELYSWPKKRLKKYNITINGNKIKRYPNVSAIQESSRVQENTYNDNE